MLNLAVSNAVSTVVDPNYIRTLVAKGGPEEKDYPELNSWLNRAHALAGSDQLTNQEKSESTNAFADAMSLETIQGFALNTPHGYAGASLWE